MEGQSMIENLLENLFGSDKIEKMEGNISFVVNGKSININFEKKPECGNLKEKN